MTTTEKLDHEYGLLEKAGDSTELIEVNPDLFRKLKFSCYVTPEIVSPPSENVKRALNLEEFDRAIALPFTNHEALARDLLFSSYNTTKSDPDKYLGAAPGQMGPEQAQQAGGNTATAMMSNQRQQESAANLLRG